MKVYFFLICLLIIVGCDFKSTKEKVLVGNITLVNPQTQSDNGYSLVYIDGSGLNDNILNDYVKSIEGNDSILIAKCINKNEDYTFYKIGHNKGDKPIIVTPIAFNKFKEIRSKLEIKYVFSDEN